MEVELEQSINEFVQNDSDSYDSDEDEELDLDALLEEIEKTEDLDILEDIHNKLISDKKRKVEALNQIRQQNAEMKEQLNASKCVVNELDQLICEEQQKVENLREMIETKRQEHLQERAQQVVDLEQFENEVRNIAQKVTTAPKEYASNVLKEKIEQLNKELDEHKIALQQQMKELAVVQDRFKEPVEYISMNLPLKVFDEAITDITALNTNLAHCVDQMSKEIDKLRLDMAQSAPSNKTCVSKN